MTGWIARRQSAALPAPASVLPLAARVPGRTCARASASGCTAAAVAVSWEPKPCAR